MVKLKNNERLSIIFIPSKNSSYDSTCAKCCMDDGKMLESLCHVHNDGCFNCLPNGQNDSVGYYIASLQEVKNE